MAVTPATPNAWGFLNDQTGGACDTLRCRYVAGPGAAPLGSGSAQLSVSAASEGVALARAGYVGVALSRISALSYATHRSSVDAGNNLAIALQLNVDYDLTDASETYQGRLVYEPYLTNSGAVVQGSWQSWNTLQGKWWGTRSSVIRAGATVPNPCVQSHPCTWSELLSTFPNLGVHRTYGAVLFKAGSGWATFTGSVDAFAIGIDGTTETFDFDPNRLLPPLDSLTTPALVQDSANYAVHENSKYLPGVVKVAFVVGTSASDRLDAIAAVSGTIIGSEHYGHGVGIYYLRLGGTPSLSDLFRAVDTLRRRTFVRAANMAFWTSGRESYRRPAFGPLRQPL